MKIKLSLVLLSSAWCGCANMATQSGPYVNHEAVNQMADTKARASEYERQGYSPSDAWQAARYDNIGGPFGPLAPPGPTPIAGYGWGAGTGKSR